MDERIGSTDLLPYVPRLVASWPQELEPPSHQTIAGSMMFADISGFTKLSEKLAKQGKVGAEELVSVINSTFAQLLAVAYGENGGLLKFGGDALLLFFSGPGHEVRCTRAAARMRRTLREIGKITTSQGSVGLRISIGVHSGDFDFYLVGRSHHDLLICGPAATQTVLMEQAAEAGEIVISESTAAALPPKMSGRPKGPGWLLAGTPSGTASAERGAFAEITGDVSRYVPSAVRNHLEQGGEGTAHRQVTVMFLHFDGVDELSTLHGRDETLHALDELVALAQEAAEKHGVSYLDSDIDKGGGKIYMAAGAPVARDDDEGRMLRAAMHIRDANPKLPIHIGLNRGHVFTGDIGPPYRRTYTFMGDAVNLAARVMSKAGPQEVLATDDVLAVSATAFNTSPLEPFTVKGKSQPVTAHLVEHAVGAKGMQGSGPFVGREEHLGRVDEAISAALAGAGSMVEVFAEGGMGKSRLVDHSLESHGDLHVVRVSSSPYESDSPYSSASQILRQITGVDPSLPDSATKLSRLIEERAASSAKWLPLLGTVIGVEIEQTPETKDLGEEFRRTMTEQAVAELVVSLADHPMIITVDDAHWMDEASAGVVKSIGRAATRAPVLLVILRRNVGGGFDAGGEDCHQIQLEPLDRDELLKLIELRTEDMPLLPFEADELATRSGGNPLFLEQLLANRTSGDGSLPDTLEKAIAIRIDRLPPRDRIALRRLAVLGPSFSRQLAVSVLGDESADTVLPRLGGFIEASESGFRFRQAVARDAAYSALPFSERRSLHAMVGELIESSSSDLASDAAILSLHFFEARAFPLVWRYAREAAIRAEKLHANVESIALYERSLEASRRIEVEVSEKIDTLLHLGDVLFAIGAFDRSGQAYRNARKLVGDDPLEAAKVLSRMVRIPWKTGKLSNAIRSITRGLSLLEGDPSPEAGELRAQMLAWYASIRHDQGRHEEAIRWSKAAIEEARLHNAKRPLAHASNVHDVASMALGRLTDPAHSREAMQIYDEIGELAGKANVEINMGGYAYLQGRWDEALELYERGRLGSERLGNSGKAAAAAYNVAEILVDQGRLEEAEEKAKIALRVWRAAGDRGRTAFAQALLARIAYLMGDAEGSLQMLEHSREVFKYIGAQSQIGYVEALMSERASLHSDPAEALRLAEDALLKAPGHAAMLERIRGKALAELDRRDEALIALSASLGIARKRENRYEEALAIQALADLEAATGIDPQDAGRAQLILEELGVRGTHVPRTPQLVSDAAD